MAVTIGTTHPQMHFPRPTVRKAMMAGVITLVVMLVLFVGAMQIGALALANDASLVAQPALKTMNFKFSQAEIHVKAGEAVALRLSNEDNIPHSLVIDEFAVHTPMIKGVPSIAKFTPTQSGVYTFYCGVPGHKQAGMVGTLVVEP